MAVKIHARHKPLSTTPLVLFIYFPLFPKSHIQISTPPSCGCLDRAGEGGGLLEDAAAPRSDTHKKRVVELKTQVWKGFKRVAILRESALCCRVKTVSPCARPGALKLTELLLWHRLWLQHRQHLRGCNEQHTINCMICDQHIHCWLSWHSFIHQHFQRNKTSTAKCARLSCGVFR